MRCLAALLLALAACSTAPIEELGTTEQSVISGVAFSPPSGGTVGDVQVGSSSAPWTTEIYPIGTGDSSYTITSITGCSDFLVNAPNLPAEIHKTCLYFEDPNCPGCNPVFAPPICGEWDITSYTWDTTFTPNVPGPSSCAITLQITGLGTKTYTLNGNGTVPPIDIDVSPTTIDFGDVRRTTTSSPISVTVRNIGGSTLTVSGTSLPAGFSISAGPTGGFTVPAGGTTELDVVCSPTATGSLGGTMQIDSDDPDESVVNVSLSCNGIDSNLDVSPSPAALDTTRVGEPVQRTVTLANTGAAAMMLEGVTLAGADFSSGDLPAPGTTIAAGGSVDVTIAFGAATAGEASAMLTVVFDGGQMRQVPVSSKALATSMSVTPDGAIELGPVCVGQSAHEMVNIAANAEGSFDVQSIQGIAAPFTLTAPMLPATIAGGGGTKLALDLGVAPTEPGPLTTNVTIATDIPGGAPRTLVLSATGLAAGVSATPGELDLGPTEVNKTTIGQVIELSNCSSATAELSNPRIEGTNPDDFAIVQVGNLMLAANGSSQFLVVATPHSVGHKSALFSIETPGGTASVLLGADGLGAGGNGDDEPGGGKASYYACSAGGAAGGLPIALALLALRRRRR